MVEISTRAHRLARITLAASLGIAAVCAAGGVAASASPGARCRPPAGYTSVDVGALGTGFTDAVAINDRGVVIGRSETPEGMHAYVWRRGRQTDITPAGGTDARVGGVNDHGEVVHSWFDPAAGDYRTAIWRNGRSTVIHSGFDEVRGINDRGEVLFFTAGLWRRGRFQPIEGDFQGTLIPQKLSERGHVAGTLLPPPPPGGGHPTPSTGFVWRDGVWTPALPPPGIGFRTVVDVDRSGRVLFDAFGSPSALWDDGRTTDLGTLDVDLVGAADMSEKGQVVGSATVASGEGHAFLWQGGTMTDLLPVEGTVSWANKVNEHGVVVGASSGAATVWACGRPHRLATPDAVVSIAIDINDRGQVLSIANTQLGDRVFVSTPTGR